MRRAFAVAALAVSLSALLVHSAAAKGEGYLVAGRADVTGPGIKAPLVLRGRTFEKWTSLVGPQSEVLFFGCCGRSHVAPPARLGPAYEVTYFLRFGTPEHERARAQIVQRLYPYARNPVLHVLQAWTYTPAGQRIVLPGHGSFAVNSGWRHSTLALDLLRKLGLPARAPDSEEDRSRGFVLGTAGRIGIGLGALVLVLGVAALVARPRRTRVTA